MDTKISVLAVEDNATEQKLLRILLGRLGLECTIASSGHMALEILSQPNNFSLILMDWQMTDMDGLECTRQIRQLQLRSGNFIPIVAVTARVLLGDRQKCIQCGMDDYLSKPFTAHQFEAMIAKWCGRRSSSIAG